MKVAIATDGDYVSAHFGRCPSYTLLEIENGKVLKKETVENPGHQPGLIPRFLNELGVNCIIAGGMGARAKEFFNEFKIDTIVGVDGRLDEIIKKIERGTLKGSDVFCGGSGNCDEHN